VTEQRELRASDRDRQAAAERLRAFHDEGRLDFSEYDNRLAQAYSAVTYADLDRLFADLPATAPAATVVRPPAPRQALEAAVARQMARPPALPNMPLVLRILWINWAVVVIINLAVWFVVGAGDTYFWPMWLAIPGVVLAGATAVTGAVRTHRRTPIER
jgi:hypothetical protein